MLSHPPQLNRRFARLFNFGSSKPDDTVNRFEDLPAFVTREELASCNRQAAIDLGS
jgi:hypothetical protein